MNPSPRHRTGPAARRGRPTRLACAALFAAAVLGACRGEPHPDGIPVDVDVSTAPTPPIVGPTRVVVTVTDSVGEALDDAQVTLEATMTHAGMAPVQERAEPAGDGRYVAPEFEWTMGGDWILSTRVRLPDGREAVRERELRVLSGPDG